MNTAVMDSGRVPDGIEFMHAQDWSSGYTAAASRRSKALALEPSSRIAVSRNEALRVRKPGVLWSVAGVDGLMLAVRAWDLGDFSLARRDLRKLAKLADELEFVPVHDEVSGNESWWLTYKDEVLLVSARSWTPSAWRTGGLAAAKKTLRLVAQTPPVD